MIVILMGPSGAGKTTVGRGLSAATGWRFVDADDLHPPGNITKIRAGTSLTDADRAPWLSRVRHAIETAAAEGEHLLIACSALREQYRRVLGDGVPDVRWVFLAASREALRRRLEARTGHFAGTSILESQLRTLEAPADALFVGSEREVESVVREICDALQLPCEPGPEHA